jgi:rhodanese-related sulfurtransferase
VLAGVDAVPAKTAQPVVVYCGHGPRAWMVGAALRCRGHGRVIYLRGHMAGWRKAGLREER